MIIEVQDQLRHYSLENGEAYAVALTAKGTVETARVIHHLSPYQHGGGRPADDGSAADGIRY